MSPGFVMLVEHRSRWVIETNELQGSSTFFAQAGVTNLFCERNWALYKALRQAHRSSIVLGYIDA